MQKNEFIKQIRKKYKMSQKAFAELLEVSKSLIEKVEMGKIEATPENKYVKAVCALDGLDNEIFKYDEITDEVLQKHELSQFSKAFRKFLYFYYGDFWNEEIEKELREKFTNTLFEYLSEIECYPNEENILCDYRFDLFFQNSLYLIKHHKAFSFMNCKDDNYNSICSCYENLLGKIFLILTLSKYYFSSFKITATDFLSNEEIDYVYNNMPDDLSKNNKEIIFLRLVFGESKIYSLLTSFVKDSLADLIEGLHLVPLTIENIKKLKKQKELEKIQSEVIPAPTDPKDKQICELLQYAPPAFKDKIIEKLLQYKKDVEEF